MVKSKVLNKDQIKISKDTLNALGNRLEVEAEKAKKGRRSPSREFLHQIEGYVKKAILDNVSYAGIARAIKETCHYRISPSTIRKFAESELGIISEKKQSKSQNNSNDSRSRISAPKTSLRSSHNQNNEL